MLLKSFQPSPSLREYVRSLGVVHFVFPNTASIAPKPYAPRPETSLYFFPRDPEYISYQGEGSKVKRAPVSIYGQHTVMNSRFVGHDFLTIIVHFQPGVLHRLTGIPMGELMNVHLDAELLLTRDVKYVNEKLSECRTYPEMLSIVESFLMKLIRRSRNGAHRVDAAARYLLEAPGRVSLDWLARESCLCKKQFERIFQTRTGVAASTLANINRFTKTIRVKNAHPEMDWLSVALQCGYYDYQHLVKDYKRFTSGTPATFMTMETKAPERTFGLREEDKLYIR